MRHALGEFVGSLELCDLIHPACRSALVVALIDIPCGDFGAVVALEGLRSTEKDSTPRLLYGGVSWRCCCCICVHMFFMMFWDIC